MTTLLAGAQLGRVLSCIKSPDVGQRVFPTR